MRETTTVTWLHCDVLSTFCRAIRCVFIVCSLTFGIVILVLFLCCWSFIKTLLSSYQINLQAPNSWFPIFSGFLLRFGVLLDYGVLHLMCVILVCIKKDT